MHFNKKIRDKKKIVFFMPFIGGGGVEKNLFLIGNFITNYYNNLYLITSSSKYKNKFNKRINFVTPSRNLSENLNIRLKYLICLFLLFKFLIKNKNTTVFSFQANIYCIILCKFFNIKIIVRSNSSPSGWYHNFIKKALYKFIISKADIVITNSLEFKKEMQKNFKIKVKCIYNPLNINEIKKKSKYKIKDKFFNKKKSLKILNIGRLTKQKDQITILKAIQNLIQKKIRVRLLIIGRGEEKGNLLKYIFENKLTKFVKLKNFLENPYPYIKKSDLFVLSSKYEGLPNVLLESVVLKKLIVSTDCPTGPSEILDKGKGGYLFDIGDHKNLSEIIFKYYKNKSISYPKIDHAYKRLYRFDFNKNMKNYLDVIKKIN